MNWVLIGGVAVLVVIIGALFLSSRKGRDRNEVGAGGGMSTSELAEVQQAMLTRAEEAISAHKRARGAEVAPAREHMLRVADEVDAEVRELANAGLSKRLVQMAELGAEHIRESVNEAIAAHPEERQA